MTLDANTNLWLVDIVGGAAVLASVVGLAVSILNLRRALRKAKKDGGA